MRSGVLLFEAVDRLALFERQADIVETVQQAMALELVEIELDQATIRAGDLEVFEVDGQDGVGAARGVVHQLVEVFWLTLIGRMPFLKQLL